MSKEQSHTIYLIQERDRTYSPNWRFIHGDLTLDVLLDKNLNFNSNQETVENKLEDDKIYRGKKYRDLRLAKVTITIEVPSYEKPKKT